MPVMQRIVKPTTHRSKRALLAREPKLVENTKNALFIKGRKTSGMVVNCMKDLYDIKKPHGKILNRQNDILPFENITPVEEFSRKHDASMFMFASHNKKRPHNLILGRMYDSHILDMVEFGIERYRGLKEFKTQKVSLGIKPCLLFAGELFEHNHEYRRIKNLLVDMFQREKIQAVRLQGLEHALLFTAAEDQIYLRSYRIQLKKSGSRIPRTELEEIGPSIDFKVRRTKISSDDLFKLACKRPKELKVKKVKNISKDTFGTQHGRIHIPKQNIKRLQTRKMKGLKKTVLEKEEQRKQRSVDAKTDIQT
ncbi:ribosome production factor 2 homolog isoform X2 [Zootermopsis nevadensis]|uniref:Ribosome production factor 2 homolog n=1 Tax=Zootermopsis nevadensis TaxID=136037 RepID=A0A067RHP7_ZOONE|nr:ribosome production factor 2 homolog isoform X2 [Zootermopsis nevadensis]KDR23391.1 Brix domain-containing protein 1 [Zootermopsis nevadensis]